MTIAVIGHGYVGLVSGAIFADLGNSVWIVGRTSEKIEMLQKGKVPFFEPGLEELVQRNLTHGRLHFTLDYREAVVPSDIVFICVGTPGKDDGGADLSSVYDAAKGIGLSLNSYKVIVVKSTVPPGTNKEVERIIKRSAPNAVTFDMASCPEFLREGSAISDTLSPDRIVIGTESSQAKKILVDFHRPIEGKFVLTDIPTAEMIKYVANSFLSSKISFANAIAWLSEKVGADVVKVMDGVGLDKRIGRSFLTPGIGYGGSCFPKDVKALIAFASNVGYDFKLLKAVDEINKQAAVYFIEKIKKATRGKMVNRIIGVLGLAFKPNTDDMREAPSIAIIKALQKMNAKIQVYDPAAYANARKIFSDIVFCESAYQAATKADILLVLTEWNEFRQLELKKIKQLMAKPILIDGRNIYDPEKVKKMGFVYYGVGRS